MKAHQTPIPDLLLLEPEVFADERGFFYESFNQRDFESIVASEVTFVQDNHSKSVGGVLRGLHYQLPPDAQGKLVRCTSGAVWDVAVDIRRSSPTVGQWFGLELSAENRVQLWIPEGFAHGFLTLSDAAEVLYKTTAYYAADSDRSILWNDPELDIDWPLDSAPMVSKKDSEAPILANADLFV